MKRKQPFATYVGWALAVVGTALLVVWVVTMAQAAQSLRGHLGEAMALAGDPSSVDPQAACELVDGW